MTPLMIAAITNYPQCQQLQQNACQFDNTNMSALYYAIKNMNNDIAKIIFQWEQNSRPISQTNALMIAAQSGNIEMVNYIIENNNNQLQEQDSRGFTALYYALEALNKLDPADNENEFRNMLVQIIQILAPNQGNTIPQNPPFTPLQIFIKYNIQQLIQQFLNQQNLLDNKNRTCLMYAAMSGNNDLLTPFLQQQTTQDSDGCTALIYASIYGCTDAIETLAEQEWELKDNHENTPVHHAAIHNKPDVISIFDTTYEGDVNDKKSTPFMLACQNDSYQCLQLLQSEANEVDQEDCNAFNYIAKGDSHHCLINILANNMIQINPSQNQLIFTLIQQKALKCLKTLIDVARTSTCWLIEDMPIEISSKTQKLITQLLQTKNSENSLSPLEFAISTQNWDIVRVFASYYARDINQNGSALSMFLQLDADIQNEAKYYKAGKMLIKYGSGITNKDKTCASMVGWQSYDRNHNCKAFMELLNEVTQIEDGMKDSQGHDVQWYRMQCDNSNGIQQGQQELQQE